MTPTQVWASDYITNSATGDATNTLNNADNASNCINGGPTTFTSKGAVNHIACGIYGPWMVFNPQFSALAAWSSIGMGNYNALQWTIRKRYSFGLQFDINYTWSKSIDLGSAPESRRLLQRVHPKHVEPEPDASRFDLRHHPTGELAGRL